MGDHHWPSSFKKDSEKPLAQTIVEEENILVHRYNGELRKQAGLIRTPTVECNRTFLRELGLEERIEAIHNIAVSTGTDTITNGGFDSLLAGTVGPYFNPDPDLRIDEMEKAFGEPAVYLIDKGIDVLLLQGFTDLTMFQVAVRSMRRVNSVPIPLAAFFRLQEADMDTVNRVLNLADQLQIELVGFEVTPSLLEKLPEQMPACETALGFQLGENPEEASSQQQLRAACEKLLTYTPTMILGGQGLSAEKWENCRTWIGESTS
ncbi:MAG: hypothetical protein COB67_12660 [SAR324 cluster bacterium]|uniref:Hcy-binding domain-containing protein n=1 Tax=SAR324 cluster bacterium TaxID=2024889 RepID=A0A2A4SQA5_9DELT|nr:MAG: hypothetical protein COB67_12660 [SAR324 cluster bacterium]